MYTRKASKIKPLGHKQLMFLLLEGRLFFDDMMSNSKKAHCKSCGKQLEKFEGIRWLKFAPNNFYFQSNYFCSVCSAFANCVNFEPKTLKPYLRAYNPTDRELMWAYISQHWNEF